MFGILMTVCLATSGQCKDVTLATQEKPISPNQCMMQAMPGMVEWMRDNNGWTIKNWSCGHLSQLKASL